MDEILFEYRTLGAKVFQKTWMRSQYINAKYDSQPLSDELKRMFGSEVAMSDEILQTGLLVVTKRLNSGSAWPLSNNPKGRYFATRENSSTIGNGEYLIWNVVRASSAALPIFRVNELKSPRAVIPRIL